MAESVYKVIELVGTSTESWEKAAAAAIERASQSLRDLRVARIIEQDVPEQRTATELGPATVTWIGKTECELDSGLRCTIGKEIAQRQQIANQENRVAAQLAPVACRETRFRWRVHGATLRAATYKVCANSYSV